MFIQKKDPTQNKEVGVPIYIALGKKLAKRGIQLHASQAQYGPGHDLWTKLSQQGFAKNIHCRFAFTDVSETLTIHEGSLVRYEGRTWKIREIINHTYKIDGKTETTPIYNLERDDGLILQDGGVEKFIFKDDFELIS